MNNHDTAHYMFMSLMINVSQENQYIFNNFFFKKKFFPLAPEYNKQLNIKPFKFQDLKAFKIAWPKYEKGNL